MGIKNGHTARYESADPCCSEHIEGFETCIQHWQEASEQFWFAISEGQSKADGLAELFKIFEEISEEVLHLLKTPCEGLRSRKSLHGEDPEKARQVDLIVFLQSAREN
jgi:hypothetical protein